MIIESMDHLGHEFENYGVEHYTQENKSAIYCKLLFHIGAERGHTPSNLVSIKIPKGLPIGRLRTFVTAMETELTNLYSFPAKRANIVWVRSELDRQYTFSFDMPLFGVKFL